MSQFRQTQQLLKDTRQLSATIDKQLLEAKEKLRAVELQVKQSVRRSGNADPEAVPRELKEKQKSLKENISRLEETKLSLKADIRDLAGRITALEDPSKQVEELSDAFPFLLFPLRLETRFKKVVNDNTTLNQLWLRIYPDDCQVDSKEDMLSESEITAMRFFLMESWQAGGTEEAERGAWRTLVNSFGCGRASWIVERYKPLNEAAKPSKANKDDIILVIVPNTVLTPQEETAAHSYWKKFWLAEGNAQQEQAAQQQLVADTSQAKANEIIEKFKPFNLSISPAPPLKRTDVNVQVVTLLLPSDEEVVAASATWLQSPKAKSLPDRFVVMCFNNGQLVKRQVGSVIPGSLATGPDPSLPENEQLKATPEGDLFINKELEWMTDFEKAIDAGMGMKIDLTTDQASKGFDRLLVLGLRLSSDEEESSELLEGLLTNHYYTKHGFSLLKQGTPTNNTEQEASGFSWQDDADLAYDILFKKKEAYTTTDDFFKKKDGQWLAEYLGIDQDLFKKIPNGGGSDQGEARAMNMALWPATMGYFMDEMMDPLFTEKDIASTRFFFSYFMSGRGPVPAIRVGKQPYGILPATAFSRLRFSEKNNYSAYNRAVSTAVSPTGSDYLTRLYNLLGKIDTDWEPLLKDVSYVGKTGDADKILLDVLGLHAGSVEFHQRYCESMLHLYNQINMHAGLKTANVLASYIDEKADELLRGIKYDSKKRLPILDKVFLRTVSRLKGPLIDDVPLSESTAIRNYTADGKNYIQWLATSGVDKIRTQDFGGQPAPAALLYLMLRHALMLAQAESAAKFHVSAGLEQSKALYRDPAFINIQTEGGGKSKWEYLYKQAPAITGDSTTSISEHIYKNTVLKISDETKELNELIEALTFLQLTPTARLERVFAEHIDCCHYRLDAWKLGLINYRLIEQRRLGNNEWSRGIYLGAYGWLEEVRPENKQLQKAELGSALQKIFNPEGKQELVTDNSNLGYMHAPSLDQAATAAILRNAYDTNKTSVNPKDNPFLVDISSERVRLASSFLEGIRNGQSLSALLGYQFERGLHDKYTLGQGEVDQFIYPLRKKFPLVGNNLTETKTAGDEDKETSIEAIEARNVIDGLKLINHIRTENKNEYPFGLATGTDKDQVPVANNDQKNAITEEAARLIDIHDAISDIVMAESVYQVVQGNFERSAGNTEAFSKGNYPPEIEVVQTKRSGTALTQKVAIQFDPLANPAVSPTSVAQMTPRAAAEPSVNKWLASVLPAPASVWCRVKYTTPDDVAEKQLDISQEYLGLQPIDLLYLVNMDTEQSMTEMDDRITEYIRIHHNAHAGLRVRVEYAAVIDKNDRSQISFFELSALVKSLRKLLLHSRALNATDVTLPIEGVTGSTNFDHAQLQQRITDARDKLNGYIASLQNLSTDASTLDEYANKVSAEFLAISLHGIPQTGTGIIYDSLGSIFTSVTNKLDEVIKRWDERRKEFITTMVAFAASGNNDEKMELLQKAERLISSSYTAPLPPLANYETIVTNKKTAFDTVLGELKALRQSATKKTTDYLNEADPVLAKIATHDNLFFDTKKEKNDTTAEREQSVIYKQDIVNLVLNLKKDIEKRIADTDAAIAAPDPATSSNDRVQQLLTIAKKVLGEDVLLLPQFTLPSLQGDELQNSYNNSNGLLTYLQNNHQKIFPVDDWLYSVARVRNKLSQLENIMMLSTAFKPGTSIDLMPVQLPYRTDDRWLAMQFQDAANKFEIAGDTILYTAHFAVAFDKTKPQCGILADDWTEVIPSKEETTGIAFHFDQPNTEPPQVMLLAVPPVITGKWHWDDLVDTLHETLDMAKKRAIEPKQVDTTGYAQFLPATMMAVTLYWITIATNLASNNMIYEKINVSNN